ncbi:hypothetical protein FKM82_015330 [Ascaphus truei]
MRRGGLVLERCNLCGVFRHKPRPGRDRSRLAAWAVGPFWTSIGDGAGQLLDLRRNILGARGPHPLLIPFRGKRGGGDCSTLQSNISITCNALHASPALKGLLYPASLSMNLMQCFSLIQ